MIAELIERDATLTDEAAIRALYAAMLDGWNRGSAEAFAEPMTDDMEFIGFDGTSFSDRRAIVEFHAPLFRTHLAGTRLTGEVTSIRFVAPNVALLHATGDTIPKGGDKPAPERRSIQTLVAVMREGEWRLTAFQNTRVRPIGRDTPGTMHWLIGDWLWRLFAKN